MDAEKEDKERQATSSIESPPVVLRSFREVCCTPKYNILCLLLFD